MENFFRDLKNNLVNQYNQCPAYKLVCDSQGFDPSINLNSEEDIESIPFVTTTIFKKSAEMFTDLLRVPLESIDKWTVSSSTSGDPSIVGRRLSDLKQLKKFMDSNISDYDCVFYPEPEVMKKHKSQIIYGKPTESYIGNILGMYDFNKDTVFLIEPDGDDLTVNLEAFETFLKNHDNLEHRISIKGSTLLLYNSVNELKGKKKSFNLGKNAIVQTGGGGWDGKKGTISSGSEIKRADFVYAISSILGIPEENFIDSYSFTENSFPMSGHYSKQYKDYIFHVPKWGKVIIRDIKTLKQLRKPGDKGFIQMLNAYGTSAFAGASILVDDIGEIVSLDKCPVCGEECMTIKIVGRVKGAEAKGCGATLNVRREN